jgi:hypothetical protein
MRCETEEFVVHVIREDLSILTFLDANFSFLNNIRAQHYGIEGVKGLPIPSVVRLAPLARPL